jgi:hypothetical protein
VPFDVQKGKGGRKAVSDKAFAPDWAGHLRAMKAPAGGATVGPRPVFPADQGILPEFDLLLNLIFGGASLQVPAAGASHGRRVENVGIIKLLRREGLTEMRFVAELSADFSLASPARRRQFDDIGDGGLEELREFFRAAASSCVSRSTS